MKNIRVHFAVFDALIRKFLVVYALLLEQKKMIPQPTKTVATWNSQHILKWYSLNSRDSLIVIKQNLWSSCPLFSHHVWKASLALFPFFQLFSLAPTLLWYGDEKLNLQCFRVYHMALTFPQSIQEPIKMHTLVKFGIVPFDGHALWNPARQSMKVNTLKSNHIRKQLT